MSQKNKLKLAVLVSNVSPGTDLRAILEAMSSGQLQNLEICAVVSDKSDAPGFESARKHNLKMILCPAKEDLLEVLKKLNPDYIALAGWKQIILDEVILAYPNKILNLHPGLIPDSMDANDLSVKNPDGTPGIWNKGKMTNKAIQNFLDQKATYAGASIHFLTKEFDFGPVLGKVFEKIEANDNIESLYTRLKKKENQLYVEVLSR